MINAKYRNHARKAHRNVYRHSNIRQTSNTEYRRRITTTTHQRNIRRRRRQIQGERSNMIYANYAYAQKNSPNGTRNRNRHIMRQRANKTKLINKNMLTTPWGDGYTTRQNYGKHLYTYIQSARKDRPDITRTVTKLEQWGTEQEIRQLGNAYKRRTEPKQEISRRNKNQPESEMHPTSADSTSMATSSKIRKRAYQGNSVCPKANH